LKFFVIDDAASHSPMGALAGRGFKTGPSPCCPKCGGFAGWPEWLPPRKAELELFTREFADLAPMSGNDLLISERFAQMYRETGLIGLRGFSPVEIKGVRCRYKMKVPRPKYLYAVPAESMAAFDSVASECEWEVPPACDLCRGGARIRWKRTLLEPGAWSGEDIFSARGSTEIMVSCRFKTMCDDHGLKIPRLVPAETYGVQAWRRMTPSSGW
jgi:hypothetical protein